MTQNTARSAPQPAPATAADAPLPTPKERRRLREAKGMTEKQAATTVGVTRATIRSWETGRTTPRGRKGEAYARLLRAVAAELRQAEERARRTERAAIRAAQERSAARRHQSTGQETAREAVRRRAAEPGSATDPASETAAAREAGLARPAPEDEAPGTGATTERSRTDGTDETDRADGTAGADEADGAAPGDAATGSSTDTDADSDDAFAVEPGVVPAAFDRTATLSLTPGQAFDALYSCTAPALVRQAYLLTGRRALSRESVERAFHRAWENWPKVAVDRDPESWVRAAAYEYALSPWHRLRRTHRRPDPLPEGRDSQGGREGPGSRALREALLALPPSYRRTLLLYDGLGLDLPETAAETEASTPATAHRLLHARDTVCERVPGLPDAGRLGERLGTLVRAVPAMELASAPSVRNGSERRAKIWTRAAIAFTVLIIGATSFTLATAPRQYDPPQSPPEQVGGVPVPGGPERLTPQDLRLRALLRAAPMTGPHRLVPMTR
ncbi:helix-turn-helix domain-containing protein [Streptomyces sp. NPDC093085]|uniref:helix-turn-helix domain-containing protein n=1 Tax=Streptomyces sp. NPDC093085 TaxID=3155068 RepID=UPI0034342388